MEIGARPLRGCCDGNPTLASVNSSQLQPTGDVETLTPASNTGLALFTDTSLRSPPPYFSLHMGHAPSSHLSSDFPLIAPTAAAALTSNGYWRPSRSFGGLTCPQFVPCPGWTPILIALPGPLRPLPSWRPSRDCERTPCTHRTPTGPHAATCLLYTSPSPRDATLSRMPSSA